MKRASGTFHGVSRYMIAGLCSLLALGLAGMPAFGEEGVLPVSTVAVTPDWQGDGRFETAVDEQTGYQVMQYSQPMTTSSTSLYVDIKAFDLKKFDALTFAWRSTGDALLPMVSIQGKTVPEGIRNYYLFKRPVRQGEWQRVWLDLRLDDDGVALKPEEVPHGKVRIRFTLALNQVVVASPEPRVCFRLKDMAFVRPPVALTGVYRDIREIHEAGRVGQAYTLTLRNRTTRSVRVALRTDPAALTHFSVEIPETEVRLAKGETRRIEARITTSDAEAAVLGPLYSEAVPIFLTVPGNASATVPWNLGYRLDLLRGAVPLPARPAPVLMSDEERAEGLARLQAPEAVKADARLLREADALLATDFTPPALLHGNPNNYFDRTLNSQLRFHGHKLGTAAGPHWSEKANNYIDITKQPEEVQRAAAYTHHGFIINSALTLARAGWASGQRKYFEKAASILMRYAEAYPRYPVSNASATGFCSRIGWGILQESWWYAAVPPAYDLVHASGVWTEAEAEKVRRNLVLEGALVMRVHRSVANQQAEYNRSVGVGGIVAGSPVLAAEALSGEYGMRAQWALDFDGDGWTMERDLGYHRAALGPFLEFAEALHLNGVPAFDRRLKQLVDAPILRNPELVGIPMPQAYAHYKDPLYARTLAAIARQPLPEPLGGFPNTQLEASGSTILRGGAGAADLTTVTMNWGEPSHRSGKVLFDPLITWRGTPLNARVERIAYGYKESGFSYTAAAGNSLVFDGKTHSMLRADTEQLLDGPYPAGRWVAPLERPQAPGVMWARSAFVCGDSVLLVDQVRSRRRLQVDWLGYLPGDLVAPPADGDWQPYPECAQQGSGYDTFRTPLKWNGAGTLPPLVYALNKSTARGRLALLYPPGTEVFRVTGPVTWHPRWVPMQALRRQVEGDTWFAALYSGLATPDAAPPTIERLPVLRGGKEVDAGEAIAFRLTDGKRQFILLTADGAGHYQVGDLALTGPLAVNTLDK